MNAYDRQRQSEVDARNAALSAPYYAESAQRIEVQSTRRPVTASPCIECLHFDPAIGCNHPLQRSVDNALAFWVYGLNRDGSREGAKGKIPTPELCHHFEGGGGDAITIKETEK